MTKKLGKALCLLLCMGILFSSFMVTISAEEDSISLQVIPIDPQQGELLQEGEEKSLEVEADENSSKIQENEESSTPQPMETPLPTEIPTFSEEPKPSNPPENNTDIENDNKVSENMKNAHSLFAINSYPESDYNGDKVNFTYYNYSYTLHNSGTLTDIPVGEIVKLTVSEPGYYCVYDNYECGGYEAFLLYDSTGTCIGVPGYTIDTNDDYFFIEYYTPRIITYMDNKTVYYLYTMTGACNLEKISGEDGSYRNPYIIQTVSDFLNIKQHVSENKSYHYILANDLDFKNVTGYEAIGTEALPFKGELDGNFHTIKNLNISKENAALFHYSTGTIKNLKLSDSTFSGTNVASFAINGKTENCWSSATLYNKANGKTYGLSSSTQDSVFEGRIENTGRNTVIAGLGETVSNSLFMGVITSTQTVYPLGQSNVKNSYSSGKVNGYMQYEYFDNNKIRFESDAAYLSSAEFYSQLDSDKWIEKTYKNQFPQLKSIFQFNDITIDDWMVDGTVQYWLYNAMLQSFGLRWEHIHGINEVTSKDLLSYAPLVLNYNIQDLTSKKLPPILAKLVICGDLTIDFSGMGLKGGIPEGLGKLYIGNSNSKLRIDLSNNRLTGQIPKGFLSIPNAELIDLSNNYLFGPISDCPDKNITLNNNFFTDAVGTANVSSYENFDDISGYHIVQKAGISLNIGHVYRYSDLIEVRDGLNEIVNKDLSPLQFLFDNDSIKCFGNYFIPCKTGNIAGNYYADIEGDKRNLTAAINIEIGDNSIGMKQMDIQIGNEFTIMLTPDNRVFACGNNRKGQIGIESDVYTIEDPIEITSQFQGNKVVKITTGHSHVLALTEDGKVYTWGNNEYGQLGSGDDYLGSFSTKPLNITAWFTNNRIIDVFTNGDTSYALSENGKVYAWGYNNYGQVGDNTRTNRSVPIDITQKFSGERIINLVPGGYFCFALGESGKVFSWGANTLGQLGNGSFEDAWQPQDITNMFVDKKIKKLCAGMHHVILLTEENEAYGWGDNRSSQLGDANDTYSISPRKILQDLPYGIADIYVGSRSGMIKTIDGSLYAFGDNRYGQLGDGSNIHQTSPELISNQLNGDMPANVHIGMFHTFITGKSGAIYAMGYNKYGQLTDGKVEDCMIPEMVNSNTPYFYQQTLYAANQQPVCISMDMIDIEYQISNTEGTEYDRNDFYYFSSDDTIIEIDPFSGKITPKKKGQATIYLVPKDKVQYLEPSQYTTSNLCISLKVQCGSTGYQLQSGNAHSVLLTDNNEVFTWGNNRYNQLGIGTTSKQELLPQNITSFFADDKIVNIQSGAYHVLALSENGDLYTWGYNELGQIGNGTQTNQSSPLNITDKFNGEKIKMIAAGGNQSFAITETDKVYAWGANAYGQLGNGMTANCPLPSDITAQFPEKIIEIYAGAYFTFAKSETGKIYAFGINNQGQLCSGDYVNAVSPIDITPSFAGETIDIISGGMHHAIAVTESGKTFTWGYNDVGQLGNNSTVKSNIPVDITQYFDGKTVFSVSCGIKSTSAVCSDGSVYMWGNNAYGQLGVNDKSNRSIPTFVADLSELDVKQIQAGSEHSALLTFDNKIFTCGQNLYGQLGNGTTLEALQAIDITDKFGFPDSSQEINYTLSCREGSECMVVVKVQNVSGIQNKEFTLRFNPDKLTCQDLCAMTETQELSQGTIINTKLIITEFSEGLIKFQYKEETPENKVFSGIIDLLRFQAKNTGATTISIEMDEGGSNL